MSKYCKISGLTYVKNYDNDKDPHMVDLIHLSGYTKDELVDYVKAKVGYYLVPRVVMGSHFCKVSDYNKDCDDDLGCNDIMHACYAKTSCYVYFCVNACVQVKEVVLEKKCFSLKMACLLSIFLSSFNR